MTPPSSPSFPAHPGELSRPALRLLRPDRSATPDLRDAALYLSRELSWLAFNDRVLTQACDPAHPLLERVKFLAISAANLDEFFMIRVPLALRRPPGDGPRLATDTSVRGKGNLTEVLRRAQRMLEDQAHVWYDLRAALRRTDIHVLERSEWTATQRTWLTQHFTHEVAPALTPLACEPGHEGPTIPTSALNLLIGLRHRGRHRHVRIPVPAALTRFVPLPPSGPTRSRTVAFALLEDVVRHHASMLFPGMVVEGVHVFRVLRDPELRLDHTQRRLIEAVEGGLGRLDGGPIALVQVGRDMPVVVRQALVAHLRVNPRHVLTATRLGLHEWMRLAAIPRLELKDAPLAPRTPWGEDASGSGIFDRIRGGDVLAHHPFQSFATVESFLRAAADDPAVLAIKMTLYRIGERSTLPELLLHAAAMGKQVTVLVELKARLDERTNAAWSRRLQAGGVQVVHGFASVKTHAKACLVVRQESGGLRHYAHVGSGNYNPESGAVYTDLSLFTADSRLTADLAALFNRLTSGVLPEAGSCLVVAPAALRGILWSKVEREIEHARAGRPAHLVIKVNALTDDRTIRLLYEASQAGVRVDLIVRGMCRLRPGVPGVSEGIRVRSIVGRFLEHSRIYWFANGGSDELLLGSADLMERNLGRRVEVLAPVYDSAVRAHLRDVVLHAYLQDTDRAMELDADGHYRRPPTLSHTRFSAQEFLAQQYQA